MGFFVVGPSSGVPRPFWWFLGDIIVLGGSCCPISLNCALVISWDIVKNIICDAICMDNGITYAVENTVNKLIPLDPVRALMGYIVQFHNGVNLHIWRTHNKIYVFTHYPI